MLDFSSDATMVEVMLGMSSETDGELCSPSVLDVAGQNGFSAFVNLMSLAGIEDIFKCAGPFTAFVPSNAAFRALDPAVLMFLTDEANRDQLAEVLLYHLLAGQTLSSEFNAGPVQTIQGDPVDIGINPLTVNTQTVSPADIPSCNGVIHVLNGVLVPPGFCKCVTDIASENSCISQRLPEVPPPHQ